MAGSLGKIEQNIGHCEILLERDRRIAKQVEVLRRSVGRIDRWIEKYSAYREMHPEPPASRMDRELPSRITYEAFLANGLLETLHQRREILLREQEALLAKRERYNGIVGQRQLLEKEEVRVLGGHAPTHSTKLRNFGRDLMRSERRWNAAIEDLANIKDGITYLYRNRDYLESCRRFLVSANAVPEVDVWGSGGCLSNLFRHTNVGWAREMAEGADRNLTMAQKELACVSRARLGWERFRPVLLDLVKALFDDLFIHRKIESAFRVVESGIAVNDGHAGRAKSTLSHLEEEVEKIEDLRSRAFARLRSPR
jgi:hypothetical protein